MIFRNENLLYVVVVLFKAEIALAAEPTLAALSTSDSRICMWDWVNNLILFTFDAKTNPVIYLRDGRIVAEKDTGIVNIWNVTSRNVDLTLYTEASLALEELSNGLLATGDNSVKIWNISTRTLAKTVSINSVQILVIKQLVYGNYLAIGDIQGKISILDTIDFIIKKNVNFHTDSVTAIDELPGDLMVSGSYDFTVKLWNVTQFNMLHSYNAFNGKIECLKVISENDLLVGSESELTLLTVDKTLNRIKLNQTRTNIGYKILDIQVTNTNLIMVAADDGTIYLFNQKTFNLVSPPKVLLGSFAYSIALPPNYEYHAINTNSDMSFYQTTTNEIKVSSVTSNPQVQSTNGLQSSNAVLVTNGDMSNVILSTSMSQTSIVTSESLTTIEQLTATTQTSNASTTNTNSGWQAFGRIQDLTINHANAMGAGVWQANRLKCLLVCGRNPLCLAVTYGMEKNCTNYLVNPLVASNQLLPSIGKNIYYKI